MVIEKLLTDERLRIAFAVDRMETIAELCLRGAELTRNEVDLFGRTDARLWFLGAQVTGVSSPEDDGAAWAIPCLGDNRSQGNDDLH
jgi:hypothetical protein